MATSRTDPYLWLHLSGLATVPLWLDGCLAGLAVGDPIAPSTVEISLLAIVGILPVLAMQWQRPFYLFSLLAIAVQPAALTLSQRQLLRVQRHWFNRVIAVAVAAALGWLLGVIYHLAPIASDITPFTRWGHAGGWLVAAGCFWGANLCLQVAISALRLLMARPRAVTALEPYPVDTVTQDFTVVGLRLKRILPPSWVPETALPPATAPTESSLPSSVPPGQPESAIPGPAIAAADPSQQHPLPATETEIPETVPSSPDGEPLAPEIPAAETAPVSDPLPLEAASSEPEPVTLAAHSSDLTQPPTSQPSATPSAGETLAPSAAETHLNQIAPADELSLLTATDAAPAPSLGSPEAIYADVDAAAPGSLSPNGDTDASPTVAPATIPDVAPETIAEAIAEEAPVVTASHHQDVETPASEGVNMDHGVESLLDVVALITPQSAVTGTSEPSPATEPDAHHGLAHPIDEPAEAVRGDSSEGSAIADNAPQIDSSDQPISTN